MKVSVPLLGVICFGMDLFDLGMAVDGVSDVCSGTECSMVLARGDLHCTYDPGNTKFCRRT